MRSLLDGARDATLVLDSNELIRAANPLAVVLLGWRGDELFGRPLSEFIPVRFQAVMDFWPPDEKGAARRDDPAGSTIGISVRRRDGSEVPIELTRHPLGGGSDSATLVTIREIWQEKQDREALLHEKEIAVSAINSIGEGVITTDLSQVVTYLNPAAERLSGWRALEAIGRPIQVVLPLISEASRLPIDGPTARCLREERSVESPDGTLLVRRDGTEMCFGDSASPIRDLSGRPTGVVLVFHDTGERRRTSRMMARAAKIDPLTGIGNRTALEQALSRLLDTMRSETGRRGEHFVCYLDLDHFKPINDTGGHIAGDLVLRLVVEEISKELRSRDTLARVGGDEFVILLEHCSMAETQRITEACRRAVEDLRLPSGNQIFSLGVSIGVVPITPEIKRSAAVIKLADAACYKAKKAGGNRVHFLDVHDPAVSAVASETSQDGRPVRMAKAPGFALSLRSLVPLQSLPDGRPRFKLGLPAKIERGDSEAGNDATSESGHTYYGPELNWWLVQEVLSRLARWPVSQQKLAWPCCIVPLTPAALGDDRLVPLLSEVLAESGVPASALSFQLSEAEALRNVPATVHLSKSLQAVGTGFTLSECGKDLDAFAQLASLRLDHLIVSKDLVDKAIRGDQIRAAMIRTIADLAARRTIVTIAPIVATAASLSSLRPLGIGFALGEAVAPSQFSFDGADKMPRAAATESN